LVDATNGEGIYEAAMSGRFASEAVVEARTAGGSRASATRRTSKSGSCARWHIASL